MVAPLANPVTVRSGEDPRFLDLLRADDMADSRLRLEPAGVAGRLKAAQQLRLAAHRIKGPGCIRPDVLGEAKTRGEDAAADRHVWPEDVHRATGAAGAAL